MSDSKQISADVGSRLLFENEVVKVWDLQIAPGESTGLHRHETDYFYVVIGDGCLQTVNEDGTRQEPKEMKDGEVHFRKVESGAVHDAVNVADTPWRNIVVELKKQSG